MKASTNGGSLSAQELTELMQRLNLAPRQTEIVTHLLFGKADKPIAREMNIAVPTVRTHMRHLFRKFGVSNRVDLILCVLAQVRRSDSGHQTQRHEPLQRKNT